MSVFSSATINKIDAIQFIVINLRKTYFFFVGFIRNVYMF